MPADSTRLARRSTVIAATIAGLAAATALAAPPPPDGSFKGQTNQTQSKNRTVELATTPNGEVSLFDIHWIAKCKKPPPILNNSTTWDASGTFPRTGDRFYSGKVTYFSKPYAEFGGKKKFVDEITVSMKGHFVDSDNAKGTFRVSVKVHPAAKKKRKQVVDTCAGSMKWTVHRV